MKPKCLLHSCDKYFSESFIEMSSDKLSISVDHISQKPDYQFIFIGDDKDYLAKSSQFFIPSVKTVIVLHSSLQSQSNQLAHFGNAKLIYYHDLIADFSNNYTTDLMKSSKKNSISIPSVNSFLYSVTLPQLIDSMHEAAFTYYSDSQHSLLIHDGMSIHSFAQLMQQYNSDLSVKLSNSEIKLPQKPELKVTVDQNLEYINSVYQQIETQTPRFNISFEMPSLSINRDKALKIAFATMMIPLFIFGVSVLSLMIGYWNLDRNTTVSKIGFEVAEHISLNRSFRESGRLGGRVLALTDSTNRDLSNASPNELREYLADLEVSLNTLYKEMSFNRDSYLFSDLIGESREIVLTVHDVVEIAPILLGLNKETSFIVLFNDNNVITKMLYIEAKDGYVTYSEDHFSDEIDTALAGSVEAPYGDGQWLFKYITWEGDFPAVSARSRWFVEKSFNINPDHVVMLNSSAEGVFESILSGDKFLLDLEFLKQLLVLSQSKNMAANSNNVSVQAFFENENLSSKSTNEQLSFYQDEFSLDGLVEIDRSAEANINLLTEETSIEYVSTFKNTSNKDYEFWTKLFTNSDHTFEKVTIQKADEETLLSPKIYKNLDKKVAESAISLKPNETAKVHYQISAKNIDSKSGLDVHFSKNIFLHNMPIKVAIINDRIGSIKTTPHMNLTGSGELSYTTSLERPLDVSIKFEQ